MHGSVQSPLMTSTRCKVEPRRSIDLAAAAENATLAPPYKIINHDELNRSKDRHPSVAASLRRPVLRLLPKDSDGSTTC